ncbi:MAG: hypothetical protein IIB77_12610 [Proteobacteria bacterium]|nr:hypothetical protein [Pseudomonadota bacterium]
MKTFPLFAAAFLLTGCFGGALNQQNCAGLDLIRVDLEAGQPTMIDICFGREKDLARFKVIWPQPGAEQQEHRHRQEGGGS